MYLLHKWKDAIIPSKTKGVKRMPSIACSNCGKPMTIEVGGHGIRLIGKCICTSCKSATGFESDKQSVIFVSGKTYGQLTTQLPDIVKTLYSEAESCFFAGAPNASAAMCRASIETDD